MMRTLVGIFLLALVAFAAGENDAVVGKWALTATDVNGSDSLWTLVVKEEGGKLVGTLGNADGASVPLQQPVLAGSAFTFKVTLGEAVYSVESKIEGKKLTGKFSGPEASGTLKAVKE